VLGTNLTGPWLFTDRLVKALIADQAATADRWPRRRGSILFISSLHDRFPAREAHYSVSKAGVAMLVKAMAKDARLRPRIPAGLPGVPADVARVALFLLSDAWSGYVTGQNIAVDGGLSLHNWLDE
jgi:NAD(P)-dependent dehydrogenase (short-subunit alcohol dehydrogenase family)